MRQKYASHRLKSGSSVFDAEITLSSSHRARPAASLLAKIALRKAALFTIFDVHVLVATARLVAIYAVAIESSLAMRYARLQSRIIPRAVITSLNTLIVLGHYGIRQCMLFESQQCVSVAGSCELVVFQAWEAHI